METPVWIEAVLGVTTLVIVLVGAVNTMAASEAAALRRWGFFFMFEDLKNLLFDEDGYQRGGGFEEHNV